jgi:polar amino acid transport system substrate-binding protein
MKKWIALVTAIIAMVALAACQAPAPSAAPSDAAILPAASPEASAAASEAPAAGGVTLDSIKAKGELVVATNAEYPPFEMLEGEKFVGIDMEVAQIIADKLGVKLKLDNMSFDAVLAAVPSGKCDLGMSSLSITEDRAKVMDFSDPYMETSIKMIVAKDSAIATLDDLVGKKIGVQLGTLADTTVASFVEGAEVSRMNKDSDALMELINGKVDAVMTDSAPAQALVEKNADKVKLVDEPLSSDKLAIATKKGNAELIAFVNSVLKDMQADGSFQKIVEKYIPAAK